MLLCCNLQIVLTNLNSALRFAKVPVAIIYVCYNFWNFFVQFLQIVSKSNQCYSEWFNEQQRHCFMNTEFRVLDFEVFFLEKRLIVIFLRGFKIWFVKTEGHCGIVSTFYFLHCPEGLTYLVLHPCRCKILFFSPQLMKKEILFNYKKKIQLFDET